MPRKKSPTELTLRPLERDWLAEGKDYIGDLSWSPDGTRIVRADASGTVSILDGRTGSVVNEWHAHKLGALKAKWSSTGKYLASCGQDGKATIYNGSSLELLADIDHGNNWVENLVWHHTKDIFLTGAGKDLNLWNADGALIKEFAKHPSTIADVAWNQAAPDHFATSSYNGPRLWNIKDSNYKRFFEWKGSLLNILYSPNGKVLAAGCQDGAAHIWLLPSGEDLYMNGYPTKVRELSFDSSSRYLATGGGTEVIVWDFAGKGPSGSTPLVLPGHESFISVLAFAPKGLKLASGGLDGEVFIWEIGNNKAPVLNTRGDSDVSTLAWRPDEKALAVGFASGETMLFTT